MACASGSARWHGTVETPKKWESAARPKLPVRSASRRFASQTVSTTGAAMRRPVRSSTSRSRKPRSKRALCATSAASPANARNRRIASSTRGAPRRAAGWMPVSAVTAGGSGARGSTSVSKVSSSSRARTRCAPISQIRALRGVRPVVSRSTTTKCACSSRTSCPAGAASPTDGAAPGEARVARDDVLQQRAGEGGRGAREGEEAARRLVGRNRPAPRLDELDEAVGGVEGELHALDRNRTYVRSIARGEPLRG